MRNALLGVAMLALACGEAAAQESWQPPRTPDGKPDLQGIWTNASLTTLERPPQFKTQTIPADRAQADGTGAGADDAGVERADQSQ